MANRRTLLIGALGGVAVVGGGILAVVTHHHAAQTVTVSMRTGSKGPTLPGARSSSAPGSPTSSPLMMPVSGKVVSAFGWQYSGALNEWYYNPGISIAAQSGTAVRAAWSGRVAQVATVPHLGLTVTVNNGDGFETVYGHLGNSAVKVGDLVRQGQAIGQVGATSLYSRQPGAHLDFQIFRGKSVANPMNYLHPSS
ncbi:MAG: M23 family metallopeptidase [Thermaerobacter sp.]|nr:M23 family metallopeptidase [Thermaerobacter sp.]